MKWGMAASGLSNKKTPPLAAKRNGGAGTEKRPTFLMIPLSAFLSIVWMQKFFDKTAVFQNTNPI
jgi:hypothetical protein